MDVSWSLNATVPFLQNATVTLTRYVKSNVFAKRAYVLQLLRIAIETEKNTVRISLKYPPRPRQRHEWTKCVDVF